MEKVSTLYEVLKRPVISEKSNKTREDQGKYSFVVRMDASKDEIKAAVSKMFNVKVATVRTMITRGKVKRRGIHVSPAKRTKKAIVRLAQGEKIKLFEDQ